MLGLCIPRRMLSTKKKFIRLGAFYPAGGSSPGALRLFDQLSSTEALESIIHSAVMSSLETISEVDTVLDIHFHTKILEQNSESRITNHDLPYITKSESQCRSHREKESKKLVSLHDR